MTVEGSPAVPSSSWPHCSPSPSAQGVTNGAGPPDPDLEMQGEWEEVALPSILTALSEPCQLWSTLSLSAGI